MVKFFKDIEYDKALEIEQLSKLAYELRENRNAVIAASGASDEHTLLELIASGAVAEHPGYELYLSARILGETRETARTLLAERLKEASQS